MTREHEVHGRGGWKMSLLHLSDPEYREGGRLTCTRAQRRKYVANPDQPQPH